jgi:hypothetical protein
VNSGWSVRVQETSKWTCPQSFGDGVRVRFVVVLRAGWRGGPREGGHEDEEGQRLGASLSLRAGEWNFESQAFSADSGRPSSARVAGRPTGC